MNERRIAKRYALVANIKLMHPSFGEYITTTTDASDSGIFIKTGSLKLPDLNAILQVQIINPEVEMPIKEVRLARIVKDKGIGLAFCEWEQNTD
ncbi:MAG: PilZ domain-containing protein [Methylococcales bacterium]|nr:PilZ domain-containing protein [Methylococcales bacterium]